MSRPTRGQCRVLPVRGCHPLWPDFPDGSGSDDIATGLVRVRSPLLTESRLMSFPPGTEMFQFPGFASPAYGFSWRYRLRGGLPHSEIPGSKPARGSPRLNAACHVLHRLSTPRHPPNALRSLACHPAPAARPAVLVGTTRTREPDTGCQSIPMPNAHGRRRLHPKVQEPSCRTRPRSLARLFTMSSNDPASRPAPRHLSRNGSRPDPGLAAEDHGGPGPIRTADLTLIRGAL